MLIRLFTAGTHNQLTFSNDNISAIFEKTKAGELEKIPFVLGHPKNDLPVVGWISKTALKLYGEGEKQSIGFSRDQAEFCQESIDTLKELGRDKISVRLTDGAITHIGLVKSPAVKENESQTFSDEGVMFFNAPDALSFNESLKDVVKTFVKEILNNPLTKKDKKMDNKEFEALKLKNEQLEQKLKDKETEQAKAAKTERVNAFKAEFSADQYKGKIDLPSAMRIATALAEQSESFEFEKDGETVKRTALQEFSALLKASAVTPKIVKNGSVVNAQFSNNGGNADMSAKELAQQQFANLK